MRTGCEKNDTDNLLARINLGISQVGMHLVDEADLAVIWNPHNAGTHEEKRALVEDFARANGLDVHISSFLHVAIFRKPNPNSTLKGNDRNE